MKKDIKLICIDMDGTLLDSNHRISDENKAAVKRAYDAGVQIAVTTGRIFCSARRYSDLIGVKTPIIASNGAYIKDTENNKVFFENTLDKDMYNLICSVVKKYNLNVFFNTPDTLITTDELPEDHAYKELNKDLHNEFKLKNLVVPDEMLVKFDIYENLEDGYDKYHGQILKGICIEEERKDDLMKAKAELIELAGDRLHVVSSWSNNFEIMADGSSKGNAVKALANELNIPLSNVMCIGDSENDLSMLKVAGYSVAMGNGMDIIKEIADFVTKTNDESGVAFAINSLFE